MNNQIVIISFGPEQEYEFNVRDGSEFQMDKERAREWLSTEFDALECSPSNPMGKILILDMILNVAKYGGEALFQDDLRWSQNFAAAVAASLDRPAIRIDVPAFEVG